MTPNSANWLRDWLGKPGNQHESCTPLEARPDLIRARPGAVFLKREDTYDNLGSGHKARKLEWILDRARGGSDCLVTVGSVPSSQSVAVASAATRRGFDCHLVYCGDRQVIPPVPTGNYLLALLHQPRVTWHENTSWSQASALLRDAVELERSNGMRPLAIPPGMNTVDGLRGSIDLGFEIALQLGAQSLEPRQTDIVVLAGTGTTSLGLSLVRDVLELDWRVFAISISPSINEIRKLQLDLHRRWTESVGVEIPFPQHSLLDAQNAYPYGEPDRFAIAAAAEATTRHGVIFDPTYMINGYRGLLGLVESETIPADNHCVLVHTGGSFGMFGESLAFHDWLSAS